MPDRTVAKVVGRWIWDHGISSLLHGLLAVGAVLIGALITPAGLPAAFGAGMGYALVMGWYTRREVEDIRRYWQAEPRDWEGIVDSFLDWVFPAALGLLAAVIVS